MYVSFHSSLGNLESLLMFPGLIWKQNAIQWKLFCIKVEIQVLLDEFQLKMFLFKSLIFKNIPKYVRASDDSL